ncbi:MAG: hypothetical protein K9N06_14240, partial [Candidatus Cloacimonetes bacterium]|nr:hypothetical protein [Candidatus Cloacimonadota bacterium]
MKRLMILSMLLLPFLLAAYTVNLNDAQLDPGLNLVSQSSHGVTLTYSLEEFQIEDVIVNGDTLQNVLVEKSFFHDQAGAPDLPALCTYIAISQGAGASVNVVNYKVASFQNIDLAPAPEPRMENEDSLSYFFDESIFLNNDYYPDNFYQLGDNDLVRGVDCCPFAFRPFRYNPVTDELKVYYDIQLEINFSGGNGHFGEDRLRSRWWEPINKSFFINHESLPEIDFGYNGNQRPDGCEYLIICLDDVDFVTSANVIKDYRTRQGILTDIITFTSEEGDDYTEIEDEINFAYSNWDIPPVAFLILADVQDIVSPLYNYSGNLWLSDNVYADVNGNNLPDMFHSRITARDSGELDIMVNKFITYEEYPPMDPSFYQHPVVSGGWEEGRTFIFCTEVVAGYLTNALGKLPIREYGCCDGIHGPDSESPWLGVGHIHELMYYFGSNGLDYLLVDEPCQLDDPGYNYTDWNSNADDINQAINNGCFLFLNRAHGTSTSWLTPHYCASSEVEALVNENLPLIISINCLTGNFDSDTPNGDCLAEKFHRFNYGALGVIAPTYDTPIYSNTIYTFGIYDYFWSDFLPDYGDVEDNELFPGMATVYGKYYLHNSSWTISSCYRIAVCHLYHFHGDAFTTLYTELPQELNVDYPDYNLQETDQITVNVDDGAYVCLSLANEIFRTGVSENGSVIFEFPPFEEETILDMVITKRNYRRFTGVIHFEEPLMRGEVELHNYVDNSGVLVELRDTGDNVVFDIETDYDGVYYIYDVTPGDYYLRYSIIDPGKGHYPLTTEEFTYTNPSVFLELDDVALEEIDPELIYVDFQANGDEFPSIDEALVYLIGYINSSYFTDETITVSIAEGDYYTESTVFSEMINNVQPEMPEVSIIGDGNVYFYPLYDNHHVFEDVLYYNLTNIDLVMNNITFRDYTTAANIEYMNNSQISFIDCVFEDNGLYWNEVTEEYENFSSGGAIKLEDHGDGEGILYLRIEGCTFINNQVSRGDGLDADFDLIPINNGMGGAICIDLRSNEFYDVDVIEIAGNVFEGCGANYGGAIFMNEAKNVYIAENEFRENHFAVVDTENPSHNTKKGSAIALVGTDLNMTGNLFTDQSNYQDLYGEYVNWFSECGDISSLNNSYIDNNNLECLFVEDSESIVMKNDLYHKGSGLVDYSVSIEDTPYEISYCLSYGQNGLDFVVDGTGVIENCFYIDPELDVDFVPVWDLNVKSVCID